jgi:transcriptional regulator with XRE-family HTH domain
MLAGTMPRPHKEHDTPHPLQQWRAHVGMSQADLAKACGLTQGAISHIENYNRIAVSDALEVLRRVTGLPTDAFVRPRQFLQEHPNFLRRVSRRRPQVPPPEEN